MDLDAISWAARTRGCTVISQSFHRDAEQTDSGLSFDDMYKDWLVLHWPYPTILQAAGNGASTEFVNHKGYNSLTVANHDDTASSLASDSVSRNPASSHQRPGAAGAGGERHRRHDRRADDERDQHGRPGCRRMHGSAPGGELDAQVLARGLPGDPARGREQEHHRQHVVGRPQRRRGRL